MNKFKRFILIILAITLILVISSCSNDYKPDYPTVVINQQSNYESTFKELGLGILFDFEFYLPDADERWVNLWVERYRDGIKDSEPLDHLSYGNHLSEVVEGKLGFGIINQNSEESLLFLYSPEDFLKCSF